MIDYRFSLLANGSSSFIPLSDSLDQMKMSEEEFLIELDYLNRLIDDLSSEQVVLKEDKIFIPDIIKERWLDIFFGELEDVDILHESQRKAMIYLMVFMQVEELSVFHFQDFLFVSKNTVLKDIKNLREELSYCDVKLLYSRKKGFYVLGDEMAIRSVAYNFTMTLINDFKGKRSLYRYLYNVTPHLYNDVRYYLFEIKKRNNLIVVPSRFEEMIYIISVLFLRIEQTDYQPIIHNGNFIQNLSMHQTVREFVSNFDLNFYQEDIEYVTILFMICTQGDVSDSSLDFLMDCCSEMIYEIERLAVVHFENFKKILLELFYHLVPAYFRITYDLPIDNGLIDEIKIQYEEIYELTTKSLYPFELLTQKKIPEEEIGYITILFGGEILNKKELKTVETLEAVIICPSGISSSVIMKSELQKLFPQINFKETTSIEKFNKNKFKNETDIIFSSTPIQSGKKIYVINPIMNQLEKSLLVRQVQEDFLLQENLTPTVNELLDIIIPHIELKKGVTRDRLSHLLQKKINKNMIEKEDNRPMLSELLTEDMIQIVDNQENWELAIEYASEPLKNKEMVEDRYVEAMIQKVKDYGPFINIGKGVALPHARPEDGVNKLGMSLLKVNDPVLLSDDEKHPINLFICLAAVDNETHLKALASLTRILSDKEKLNGLLKATTKNEIINIIIEGED